jgi:hypothetical protein
MSMSKVIKYSNHNDNGTITISIFITSNPSTVHQTYYEMTTTDKMSLIIKSVMTTQIDIHPAGEEPDQHAVRTTHRVPRTTTICEVPTKSKLVPCSWVKSWLLASFPLQQTSLKQGVRFGEVLKRLLGLPGHIKTRHAVSTQLKTCHRGQNGAVLNRHGWGLPHRNLEIATTLSPSFPSECSTDPPTCLARYSNSKINITSTHHIQYILLVHDKRGAICEWDLPLDFYRWLSTTPSRSSRKK